MEVKEKFYLLLHPRPAYVIGSGRFGEVVNFMAASWVTPVAEEPPRVAVAIDVESYTHELISKYKEFTVNVLPMAQLNALYSVGIVSGRRVDKVARFGLNVEKGRSVNAPVLTDSIGVLECRVTATVESEDTTLFVGDVLTAYAKEEYFDLRNGWNVKKGGYSFTQLGAGILRAGPPSTS